MESAGFVPIGTLTEEEINRDLKKNLQGQNITLTTLVNEANQLFPLGNEEIMRAYNCGYHLRRFIEKVGTPSFVVSETLPVVFALAPSISVEKFYKVVTSNRGTRSLDELGKLGIVKTGIYNASRATFKTNGFDTIRKGVTYHISRHSSFGINKLNEKFDEYLGILKPDVNKISKCSASVFEKFNEWWGKEERKGNPRYHWPKFVAEVKPQIDVKSYEVVFANQSK